MKKNAQTDENWKMELKSLLGQLETVYYSGGKMDHYYWLEEIKTIGDTTGEMMRLV